jgi:hypothetical protein
MLRDWEIAFPTSRITDHISTKTHQTQITEVYYEI